MVVIFLIVPVLVYDFLRKADDERFSLITTLEADGRFVPEASLSYLQDYSSEFADDLTALLPHLNRENSDIKVVFYPSAENSLNSMVFVSSFPKTSTATTENAPEHVIQVGLMSPLGEPCETTNHWTTDLANTAATPSISASRSAFAHAEAGPGDDECWTVTTSLVRNGYLGSAFDRSYWRTPELQLVAAVYVFMALLILSIFMDVWRNLRRFSDVAHAIRRGKSQNASFRARNRIPELAGVATEFDRLVFSLRRSEQLIRQAAEENAHALKGPLAVISQSIEPIRKALPSNDKRGHRGLILIESSIGRLDRLISAARRIEEATAEMLDKPMVTIDLPHMLPALVHDFRDLAEDREIALRVDVAPGLRVLGNDELLETAIENVLDNALDFSPAGSTVTISAAHERGLVRIRIDDEGPAVPEKDIGRIFDHHFSTRASDGIVGNYGIGLWIVQRNVEMMGGEVAAIRRAEGGLRVEITLSAP